MQRESSTIDLIGEDLLHNILSRLPASSCASVACVSRFWNHVATRLLSSPKFSSALSLNPSLQGAVNEVVNEVLSQPIRPQFAIASIGPSFSLKDAHALISRSLGSRTPLVTCISQGIIGRDALTHEFREVQWDIFDEDDDNAGDINMTQNENFGVLLIVGFFPGLRVSLIPLLQNNQIARGLMLDEFVMSIREYTSLVSGTTSPLGIIMFSDRETDMRNVVMKMDYAFSTETVIVGDGGGQIIYQIGNVVNTMGSKDSATATLALVFAKDRNKPPGVGETQFHFFFSNGICPFEPTFKVASVRERHIDYSTWLTAKRLTHQENFDGQTLLEHVRLKAGDLFDHQALFIGVTKKRKCSVGMEKVKWITFQEFHEVLRGDEEYLYVNGLGIKNEDAFRFYMSDPFTALSSYKNVSEELKCLKHAYEDDTRNHTSHKKTILCGISFACCGRGEPFFGRAHVDSLPFLENFPGVPFAGTFCAGEIGRMDLSSSCHEENSSTTARCCLHVFSTAYLVVSYTPPANLHL